MQKKDQLTIDDQIEEDQLRFQFEFNENQINKAIKIIGREFPDLSASDLASIQNLSQLAQTFLVSPERINSIYNFSLSYGAELEATIIINGIPYPDYFTVQSQKFQESLDKQVESFAFTNNLVMPGFIPTDYDHVTGWTSTNVINTKSAADVVVAEQLNIPVTSLSFAQTTQYVLNNPNQFSPAVPMALHIYKYVILKNLTDIVVINLTQTLEDILLVAGTLPFADIALTLGRHLNLDNTLSLQTAVSAEQYVLAQAVLAARNYGAIFPQLRQTP